MSLVVVKNHTEHDIDLNMPAGERVTVPAGTYPEKGKAIIPGTASIDSDKLNALKKSSAAVLGMFDEGSLSTKAAAPKVAASTDGGNGTDGDGAAGAGKVAASAK